MRAVRRFLAATAFSAALAGSWASAEPPTPPASAPVPVAPVPVAPVPPLVTAPPVAPAPPAGPRARIAFDREQHDFGVVKQEQDLATEFTVRNDGDATLRIGDVRSDCGCSTAVAQSKELAPGASTTLRVTFRTFTMSGPVTKRVKVASNDPERPEVELKVRVDIAGGIVLDPARFYFGPVLAGTSPTSSITARWRDGVGRPFRITKVEAPGVDVVFDVKPHEAPPWHGWVVTARFAKPPAIGTVSGTALLRTDDPDYPRLPAPVTAFVSGRVWLDRREARLGLVRQGLGRTLMIGCRGLTPDVDLGEVKVRSRKGVVTAKAVRTGGNQKEWLIEVRLPEDAPPGKVEDVVEVRSALEGEPPAEIAVSGEVVPGPR
jgi:hypothetical protein